MNILRKLFLLVGGAGLFLAPSAFAQIQYVETVPPARHPQLVYWFWQSNTLAGAQYLRDVTNMAENSAFTMAFLTERGDDFYDYEKMHGPFAETVRAAHEHHLKIGLQLWDFWSSMRLGDRTTQLWPRLSLEKAIALVTEGEVTLDAAGHADYSVISTNARSWTPFHSEVLGVFAFRKTGDGYYVKNSLTNLTASVTDAKAIPSGLSLAIDAPASFAGYTAYIMVAHYHNFPDLFNNELADRFHDALEHYADIPFDGTALDEFGYMMLYPGRDHSPFRDRFYGRAFAAEFARRIGTSLERTLFDMRFAPEGHPEVRIRAINQYFDVFRDGPLRVQKQFYAMSRNIFGTNIFAGVHDVYHNLLTSDDIWRTGWHSWEIPRAYGQSDGHWPMPLRMGLLAAHSEPVTYDMDYGFDLNRFIKKVFSEARFGGRTHYHAWNDTGRWGINLDETEKYPEFKSVELKIRLLNQFDPAAPRLPVLIVFGMPALINWFPDEAARSVWDINGKLGIEEKSKAVWKAGYPCAALPSDLIDNGQLTLDAENHPVINGHRFDCLIFLYPQYAKDTTMQFLERFTQDGGKLMLEGNATYDFDGHDISDRFQKMAALATVRGFDVKKIRDLGVQPNPLKDGAFMEDGSVVFTDFDSWKTGRAKPFKVTLAGHEFSGNYIGVCALKADPTGNLEKIACGGFSELRRDGRVIFSLASPADAVIFRRSRNKFDAIIAGNKQTNRFKLNRE